MKAQFFLPSVDGNLIEGKPPISVKFEIPYFTTSGIQVTFPWFELKRQIIASLQKCEVRYLKIIEKSGYQALPWVRYITQNGDYQLRTNWSFNFNGREKMHSTAFASFVIISLILAVRRKMYI